MKEIEVFGKGGEKNRPVSIIGKRGEYFYIRAEHFQQLKEINEAYSEIKEQKVKPLSKIIVTA